MRITSELLEFMKPPTGIVEVHLETETLLFGSILQSQPYQNFI